jgi:hypothetical protein
MGGKRGGGRGVIPNYQQEKLYLEQWGRPKLSVRKKLLVNRNCEEWTLSLSKLPDFSISQKGKYSFSPDFSKKKNFLYEETRWNGNLFACINAYTIDA